MNCPCKECTDREIGCHSKCSKYADWKTEHEKIKNIINKKTLDRVRERDYIRESIKRNSTRRKK